MILTTACDFHRQDVATKAILKKSSQNYSLTAMKCEKCNMPLMEANGVILCVTCPKISSKAKCVAKSKRFEDREQLTKMYFIRRESPTHPSGPSLPSRLDGDKSNALVQKQRFSFDFVLSSSSYGSNLGGDYVSSLSINDNGEAELRNSWSSREDPREGDPMSYSEYNHEKAETIVLQEKDRGSSPPNQPEFVLHTDSFDSTSPVQLNTIADHNNIGNGDTLADDAHIRRRDEPAQPGNDKNHCVDNDQIDTDLIRLQRQDEVRLREEQDREYREEDQRRRREKEEEIHRREDEERRKEEDRVPRKEDYYGVDESKHTFVDHMKKYENQMKAYLSISTSFEKSIGLSYSSREDECLSVEHTQSIESNREHHLDDSVNQLVLHEDAIPNSYSRSQKVQEPSSPEDIRQGPSAHAVSTTPEVVHEEQNQGIDFELSSERENIYTVFSSSDKHRGELSPIPEFESATAEMIMNKVLPEDIDRASAFMSPLLRFSPFNDKIQIPNYLRGSDPFDEVQVGRVGGEQGWNSSPGACKSVPSQPVSSLVQPDFLQTEDSFNCARYDSQPILSMSFSLASLDQRLHNKKDSQKYGYVEDPSMAAPAMTDYDDGSFAILERYKKEKMEPPSTHILNSPAFHRICFSPISSTKATRGLNETKSALEQTKLERQKSANPTLLTVNTSDKINNFAGTEAEPQTDCHDTMQTHYKREMQPNAPGNDMHPFKDVTNNGQTGQRIERQQRGPSPEHFNSADTSMRIPGPRHVTDKLREQKRESLTMNEAESYAVFEKIEQSTISTYTDDTERLAILLGQLDSVASRIEDLNTDITSCVGSNLGEEIVAESKEYSRPCSRQCEKQDDLDYTLLSFKNPETPNAIDEEYLGHLLERLNTVSNAMKEIDESIEKAKMDMYVEWD